MIYSYFVEKLARQTFAHVQNHNYEEVLKVLAPNVSHHFAGDHALGGDASRSAVGAPLVQSAWHGAAQLTVRRQKCLG